MGKATDILCYETIYYFAKLKKEALNMQEVIIWQYFRVNFEVHKIKSSVMLGLPSARRRCSENRVPAQRRHYKYSPEATGQSSKQKQVYMCE